MIINYKLFKENYKIKFCKNKESPDITNALSELYSDKKMLIVIDKKLDKKFTNYLFKDLKHLKFDITVMRVSGDKSNKNEKFLFKIIDKLIEKKFTKKSAVLSCGGGVIGDVSALASSLYLRGLIYFHIPTTMTAIVDSCIGGKTAINYNEIINSVGNYYHPKSVFISKNIIGLIPEREFLAGIPEIIKCGLINDKNILNFLINNKKEILKRNYNFLSKLIRSTLVTKIKFFSDDVYEKSRRLNLNFGHTFAHAIEMALKNNRNDIIRHGEAVGIGMLCEIYYNEGFSSKFKFVRDLLISYNLPINLKRFKKIKSTNILKKEIFQKIFLDKKKIKKYPRIIKLIKIGTPKILEMTSNKKIKSSISKVIFSE
jgi:3-dehydroquinate synthase